MNRQPTKEEVNSIFNAIDKNGDGRVCVNELLKALGENNFSMDELRLMVSHLDSDGDRLLSLQGNFVFKLNFRDFQLTKYYFKNS